MFHIYFLGSSEGLIFDVANANFDVALWNPLRKYLEGTRRACSTPGRRSTPSLARRGAGDVRGRPRHGRRRRGGAGHRRRRTAAASSRPRPSLGDDDWRERVADVGNAPPFVVLRLWLDRPVRSDRAAFLGTGGRPPLDNVSVLERYEREAAQWAARTGGSVVELHAYSVTDGDAEVRDGLLARMHELYPETVGRDDRRRTAAAPRRLPDASRPGDFADRPTVGDARSAGGARR